MQFKSLTEIIEEYPAIARVSKYFDNSKFYPINTVIVSTPKINQDVVIYGLFVVDIEAVKKKGITQIKQDFIEYDLKTSVAIYYSGIPKGEKQSKYHKRIHNFGLKYSCDNKNKIGEYGFYLGGNGNYLTTNHHYTNENDPKLPIEVEFQIEVQQAISHVRISFTRSLS